MATTDEEAYAELTAEERGLALIEDWWSRLWELEQRFAALEHRLARLEQQQRRSRRRF